ncbi:MAG: ester cyclase [Acidimicrobiales bacterium]
MNTAETLIEAYVAAGDAADFDAFEHLFSADVVTHTPGDATVHGIAGQIEAWQAAHRGLDRLSHAVMAVVGSDVEAAARLRVSGVHTGNFLGVEPTGNQIEVDQALFIRVADGKIAEIWEVVDTSAGLRQLGVLGDQALSPGSERP